MGRVWQKAVEGATPWTRDNIGVAGIMAVAPPIAIYVLDRNQVMDWRVVRITAFLYLAAFGLYCLYRLIRGVFEVWTEDREIAVAEAALLWTFEAQALELLPQLEQVWHHWHNAGDVLLHPLNVNTATSSASVDLQMELRDFKLTYGNHLQRLALDVPRFTSKALIGSYPSNREYSEVLSDLREHARSLGATAQSVYDTRTRLR
jgi:hypothetical protein